jgi:hypothetical protein
VNAHPAQSGLGKPSNARAITLARRQAPPVGRRQGRGSVRNDSTTSDIRTPTAAGDEQRRQPLAPTRRNRHGVDTEPLTQRDWIRASIWAE